MDIKFREVNQGIVEARVIIKLSEGVVLNEITILNRNGDIEIEYPQKSFKAKTGKTHSFDIITFDTENEKTLFSLQIKNEFKEWRKQQKKVRIFDNV